VKRVCAAFGIALAVTAIAAAQPPTFRSRVDLVRLDVSVTRGGQPVRGLTPNDFRILDRGVPQRVESVTLVDELPVSVIMALDSSGSVAGPRLEHLIDAGRGLIAALRPSDRAALVAFSSELRVDVPLTADRSAILTALGGLKGRGATALRDAAWAALNLKPDDESRAMVLVFTDGVDTASWLTHSQVIAGARRLGVVIHAVELSDGPYRQLHFLPALVDATGGREWSATSSHDLRELFTKAIDEMRARYLVTFYPQGAPAPGWHELKVEVASRGEVRTRPGYFVP
jgi:Ca-activated chloride channel homolog